MSDAPPDEDRPGSRIKQIDAEMLEIDQELKRVADGKDEASSRSRAQLNERLQQLKSEKNVLLKQQDQDDSE